MTRTDRGLQLRSGIVVVAALLAALVGCGVRTDDEPRAISPDAVQFGLLEPTTSSGPTTTTTPAATATVSIYLVNGEGLITPVEREVKVPVAIEDVVDALLNGATDVEARQGLRSAITRTTDLIDTTLDLRTRVVTVNLTADLLDVAGEEQRLALAQVVYTATALGAVQAVLFEFDGELREVPDAEGATKSTPLERKDYARFDAELAAAATSTTTPPPPPPPPEN